METLNGENIFLRALEPEDLEFLFDVENDEKLWKVSNTSVPFSKYLLRRYLDNSHKDIYEVRQLRLIISTYDGTRLGIIDIFDFEPAHRRAAIGILISSEKHRSKGYGSEALALVCEYCFKRLGLHQVYANVGAENTSSRVLFEKAGFLQTVRKVDWNFIEGEYHDEIMYQLINTDVH